MKIKNWTILALTFSLTISIPVISQTNEIGLFLGGSLFHGDVGYKNAEDRSNTFFTEGKGVLCKLNADGELTQSIDLSL